MGLIRDDVLAAARRGREVIAAGIVALGGLWLIWLGGYLLFPVGVVILGTCAVWARQSWRRLRFSQDLAAPGMVEVVEGQVGYLGPAFGGFVALPDMVELRILTVQGQRLWRLKQDDGQALLIPVSAAGADRLFDVFASLPGMDSQTLVEAAGGRMADSVIWRRGRGPGNLRLTGI